MNSAGRMVERLEDIVVAVGGVIQDHLFNGVIVGLVTLLVGRLKVIEMFSVSVGRISFSIARSKSGAGLRRIVVKVAGWRRYLSVTISYKRKV